MSSTWKDSKIGAVCEVIAGQSPEGEFYNDSGKGLPFYQGKKEFQARFIGPPKTWTRKTTKTALPGDVLMSVRAPVGPVNFATEKSCIGRGLAAIRASDKIDRNFLFYCLLSKKAEISGNEGAVFASINKRQIESIPIPLPPLSEQKRTVAILNEVFEGIDTAVASAEKNLANARELFDCYLNSIFTRRGEGWIEKNLGDISAFKNGLNFTKGSKGEIIKIVGVKDFQRNFYVPTDQLETAQIDGSLSADYELRAGDILTVRSNGNKQLIGRCILASNVPEETSHSGFTIRIRASSKDVLPVYLTHFLKSKASREALVESGDGANISSLNQQALAALPVSLPPVSDQQAIADNIQALETETKNLEIVYQKKLTCIVELKQAILRKAFAGELTTRSPEAVQEAAG